MLIKMHTNPTSKFQTTHSKQTHGNSSLCLFMIWYFTTKIRTFRFSMFKTFMTTLFSLYPQTPHTNNRHTQLRASAPFKPSNDFTVNIQYKWQLWRGDQTPAEWYKHTHPHTHTVHTLMILSEVPLCATVSFRPTSDGKVWDIQLVTIAMVLSTAPIFSIGTLIFPYSADATSVPAKCSPKKRKRNPRNSKQNFPVVPSTKYVLTKS